MNDNLIEQQAKGAYCASGYLHNALVIWSNGEDIQRSFWIGGEKIWMTAIEKMILCGPIVAFPDKIAEFCDIHKTASLYVCPQLKNLELEAIARSTGKRNQFTSINTDKIIVNQDVSFFEYEDNLESDAYGRMAQVLAGGGFCWNQIKSTTAISPFWNCFLGVGDTYIIHHKYIKDYLTNYSNSLLEALECVPIKVEVNDKFREETGQNVDTAKVMISSSWNYEITDMLAFYMGLTGKKYIKSCKIDLGYVKDILPVFKTHGFYVIRNIKNKEWIQ